MAKEKKNKEKKGIKINLMATFMGTIIIAVFVAVLIALLSTVPKSKDIITEKTLNYLEEMAKTCKFEMEALGQPAEMALYSDLDNMFGEVKCEGMPSSYVYIVSKDGKMLYHPDQEKIGNPVENACVKAIVEELSAGRIPADDAVKYEYKGAIKYAGFGITKKQDIVVVTADEKEALAESTSVVKRSVIIAIVIIILFAVVGFIISRIISEPLKKVVGGINKISQGYINEPIDVNSSLTETDELTKAAKTLQVNLQSIVEEIRNASTNLSDSVMNTNGLCNTSADGATQISSAVDELASAAQSMAESVQELNAEMVEIGGNIEVITGAVTELNAASDSMNSISDQAQTDIQEVYESSQNSVAAVEAIAEHMETLTKAINEVSNATRLIGDISSQTNLLSLNASDGESILTPKESA